MKNILTWIRNQNRDYNEGLEYFHRYKLNTKHDVFFNTSEPKILHRNMLLSQVTKIYHKLAANPNLNKETAAESIKIKPEPIKIRKIEPQIKKIKQVSEIAAAELRVNKKYINKILVLSWDDLTFNEKIIFNNSEDYFLEKKSLMIKNGDIERKIRSLHSKVKTIDPDTNYNKDREKIMQQLVILEDKKAENWISIDTWKEPESDFSLDTEMAVQKALEREKLIKAHGNFIYRAEIIIPAMPEDSEKQKKKKADKIAELNRRKKELITLGSPYNRKSRN